MIATAESGERGTMALQHAKAGEIVDLSPKGAALAGERSTAIVKTDQFEAIRLIVPSGGILKSHKVSGRLMLHCLEGRVRLELAGGAIELKANEWVHLDGGAAHGVRGIEDASLLLTVLLTEPADPAGDRAMGKDRGETDRYEDCGCAYRWESEGGRIAEDN
jgi:quercetin dioxygenase-like cupin family protein